MKNRAVKTSFCTIVFYLNLIAVCAQSSSALNKNAKESVSVKWGLDRYVWSHTHPISARGEKSVIDFDALCNAKGIFNGVSISNGGRYFDFEIYGELLCGTSSSKKLDSIVVQSLDDNWRVAIAGVDRGFFSRDGKQYIFLDNQGLCLLQLGTEERHYIKDVIAYKRPENNENNWLACQLKNNEVLLQNLLTMEGQLFKDVSDYIFDKSAKWLFLQLNNPSKDLVAYSLVNNKRHVFRSVTSYVLSRKGNSLLLKGENGLTWANLVNERIVSVWAAKDSSEKIEAFELDESGDQVAFTVSSAQTNNSIWYWRDGMDISEMKLNNFSKGVENNLQIQTNVSFSDNGRYLKFFFLEGLDTRKREMEKSALDIWSYQDTVIYPSQKYFNVEYYQGLLDLNSGNIIQLNKFEKARVSGDYVLIYKSGIDVNGDRFWERSYNIDSCWISSLNRNTRKLLFVGKSGYVDDVRISPSGKYLIYFNKAKGYFSYEFTTGKSTYISPSIAYSQFLLKDFDSEVAEEKPAGLAGWLANDEGVLVYGGYDIWQLDLSGVNKPVNVTNSLGVKNRTLLSLLKSDRQNYPTEDVVVMKNDTLILRAFNKQNKHNGFYRKILNSREGPEILYMGPCYFEALGGTGIRPTSGGMNPVKAANKNLWIVQKQTATDAPNYFSTIDFKKFRRLTDIQYSITYNWITSELHSFKRLDGSIGEGVLYKPENFDPTKKYPVIISSYVATLSDFLYQYPQTSYIRCPAIFDSPVWMATHDFLVFVPDILFTKKNQWGPGTLNTIDGIAKYLSRLPYVDGNRLGVCGHSNSGRTGYYLLTHSKSFAAMSFGSGHHGTNAISLALSLNHPIGGCFGERSNLKDAEKGDDGGSVGLGNMWKNKSIWIDHTAVLQADKATSPLLLYHDKLDGDDPNAAVELYIALRRLEKKCWWLSYDKGMHGVETSPDIEDLTIRFTQFFDHYLKNAPAPRWMTHGLPSKYKRIESRFELDPAGTCALPGKNECPICKKWNEQYKKHPEMFVKSVSEWHLGGQSNSSQSHTKNNVAKSAATKP